MRFSTRTRYGLRFLLQLAALPEGGRLQLAHVARMEQISPGYLEQIVRSLRPLGILRGVRGAGGGYQLSREPSQITARNIIEAMEGPLNFSDCVSEPEHACDRSAHCPAKGVWAYLTGQVITLDGGLSL